MIIQCCYLDKYDWLVKVFYEVQPEDTNIILKELDELHQLDHDYADGRCI